MNAFLRLSALLTLGAALAAPAFATLESIKVDPENTMPSFPPGLKFEGIVRGHAVVVISVDATGRLSDSLVVGYTHEAFARACTTAMKDWRFTPARLDGAPVPAQIRLTFDFTVEGAVLSANIVNHFLFDNIPGAGDERFVYRQHAAAEIDRVPNRLSTVPPAYAEDAARQGVTGKVQVYFYIDETGAVRMPAVEPSTHPYLAETAVNAVREWKFEPATRRGRPVLIAASQEFNFLEKK